MSSAIDPLASSLVPHGVLETALYVDDLDAAERFYSGLLGLRKHSVQAERHLFYYCGSGMLLLFHPAATVHVSPGPVAGGGVIPAHGAVGAGHMAFCIFEREIEQWRARLSAFNVIIESEIAWPERGHSLYFRDPAGNSLELATPKLWGFPEAGS